MAANLYKGHVVPQVFFQFTQSGKALLKFKMRVEGAEDKRISVVVFGDKAEKNSDLQPGDVITVAGGKWKENEWQGNVTNEFVMGDYGGNLKRHGERREGIHSQGEGFRETPAPQRRKASEDWRSRCFSAGYEPNIEDPPEEFIDSSRPTDKELSEFLDYACTQHARAIGDISDRDCDDPTQLDLF